MELEVEPEPEMPTDSFSTRFTPVHPFTSHFILLDNDLLGVKCMVHTIPSLFHISLILINFIIGLFLQSLWDDIN